jgi:hypothetical protein
MNTDVKQLIDRANNLLGKRFDLLNLWQTIADNFYVERATFTVTRSLGSEFADHLMTSYPLMVRRDLGNQFSGMLRPTTKNWFHMSTEGAQKSLRAKAWLEWATGVQKRAMYDRRARFVRATKEGDHDFAAFGQCVISVELNPSRDGLLYRCWHLRDVAWCEGATGEIDTVVRKWKPTLTTLNQYFPGKLSMKMLQMLEKDPYQEVNCLHIVVPSDTYHGEKVLRTKFVSLFVNVDDNSVLEERGMHTMSYVIPRWQTVSDSQYAYSPATVCALPDARLLQAMTLTLLEAGEKAVNPPMIGVQEAIRSDMQLFAGGFTAVDAAYDERLGEVLRPLVQDKSGLPFGLEVQGDIKTSLMDAFYLNKLNLPPVDTKAMTAYEVSQRVSEYIRQALPLFEPLETDYNGAICETSFDIMLRSGGFGPVDSMPEELSEQEIQFRFESPLQEAVERQKASVFIEAKGLVAEAVALDPSSAAIIRAPEALREALLGIGFSAANMRDEEEIAAIQAAQEQAMQQQQLLNVLGQGADIAKTAGEAAGAFAS